MRDAEYWQQAISSTWNLDVLMECIRYAKVTEHPEQLLHNEELTETAKGFKSLLECRAQKYIEHEYHSTLRIYSDACLKLSSLWDDALKTISVDDVFLGVNSLLHSHIAGFAQSQGENLYVPGELEVAISKFRTESTLFWMHTLAAHKVSDWITLLLERDASFEEVSEWWDTFDKWLEFSSSDNGLEA